MAQDHWKADVGGDFATGTNWSTGSVPGAADDAILDAAGVTPYTVTSAGGTVNSIQTAAIATLDITAGTFTATAGTGTGVNAGVIEVGNGANLTVQGTLDNTGSVTLNGTGNYTFLDIGAAGATLTGGGQVILSDAVNDRVWGTAAGVSLTNVDNTISGAGFIGHAQLNLINQSKGVIDATGTTTALILNPNTFTNAGLLEATGAAGLLIESLVSNAGGTISAGTGSKVVVQSETIAGGSLTTSGTGAIEVTGGSALFDASTSAMTLAAQVVIENGAFLTVQGTLDNTGSVTLNGSTSYGAYTFLEIGAVGATLTGGGQVILSDAAVNDIAGAAAGVTLTNVDNTISGAGFIGRNQWTLINQGVIDATGTAVALTLNSGAVTNAGLIETTGKAGLIIESSVSNTGTVKALGSGALSVAGGSTVTSGIGGVILTAAGGRISLGGGTISGGGLTIVAASSLTADSGSSSIAAASFVNAGQVVVENGAILTVQGTLDNTGSVTLNGSGAYTFLEIGAAGAALTGGGQVILTDAAVNDIAGAAAGVTLTNVDNTISGAGFIGRNQWTLINQGVIDATGTAAALILNSGTVTNAGLIETTGKAGLIIESSVSNTGTVKALGSGALSVAAGATVTSGALGVILTAAGGRISLGGGAISGGALTIVAASSLTADSGSSSIAAASFVNAGQMVVENGAILTVQGTLDNTGSVTLNGSGAYTFLKIGAAGLSLTGGGQVILTDATINDVYGATAGVTLTNVDNTISGAGFIGRNQWTLINQGVIDATGTAAALILNSGVVTNTGLLEATGAAGMIIESLVSNAAGTISAGTGSKVVVQSETIAGGSLTTSGTGVIAVTGGSALTGTVTDSGVILAEAGSVLTVAGTLLGAGATSILDTQAGGTIAIANAASAQVQGTLMNAGAIALAGATNKSDLRILAGGAALTGGGTVTMGGPKARIFGVSATATLTNVDNTIVGVGSIGVNDMTLINQAAGVIEATGLLTVRDAAGHSLTNAGLIEANATGKLALVSETINQSGGGTILAAGGLITLQTVDFIGGTLTTTGAGRINVDGGGAILDGGASAVTNSGLLQVTGGETLTVDGAITNSGKLDLHAAKLLIAAAGVTLSGAGQVNLNDSISNVIVGATAAAALTNVDDRIAGSGLLGDGLMALINKAGGQIIGNQGVALTINTGTHTITNAGLIENVGKGGTVIVSAVNNTGTLTAATAGTLTVQGLVTGAGKATINGATLYVQQAFTESVTFTGSTGVLKLGDSQAYTGKVTGLSTAGTNSLDLADIAFSNTKTKATYSGTTASGTLTVTDGTHTAKITLIGNYLGSTFTVSTDGHTGTKVVDPSAPAAPAPLAQAMAGFQHGPAPHLAGTSAYSLPRFPMFHARA